jgi:glutamine amidotransferase
VQASHLVLPGVGAFRDAIAKLRSTGLDRAVVGHIEAGKPFLGICLGLQMLFDASHEDGVHDGLGLLKGEVIRFTQSPGLKVPHMGWNQVEHAGDDLFHGLEAAPSVYFVHSYFAKPVDESIVSGWTEYGGRFAASLRVRNIAATQFHPEKSQRVGLAMLRNFASPSS